MENYTNTLLVKAEIGAKQDFGTDTIPSILDVNSWIEQNSRVIDSWTNNYFGTITKTDEYLDYDGADVLSLPKSDVLTITTLEYNTSGRGLTPTWVLLEEGQDKNYLLYKDLGEVELLTPAGETATNNPRYTPGSKKFKVTYNYGYESVPKQIERLATLMTAKNVIQALVNKKSSMAEVKVGAISVKPPTSFSINYIKSLNDEISMLKDSIGEGFKVFRFTRVYR